MIAGMIQQCIDENARIVLDQSEYQKRYDGLSERFDRVKGQMDAVTLAITEKLARREKIEMFLTELEQQDGTVTEFRERIWYSLVDYVTVFSKEDIHFTFKNGMEIKV